MYLQSILGEEGSRPRDPSLSELGAFGPSLI
jgi:hypothetical protein